MLSYRRLINSSNIVSNSPMDLENQMLSIKSLQEDKETPVIITDDQGIVISINSAFESTFGWSWADIVGQPMTLILPAYFKDSHTLGFSRFKTTGNSTILNHPLLLKAVTKDNREIDSEHYIIAEKIDGHWVFAATLRPILDGTD